MKTDIFDGNFWRAAREYHYLISRGYPSRASLELVGDRRELGKTQRTVLYRGIFHPDESIARSDRIFRPEPEDPSSSGNRGGGGKEIIIDLLNVVFTVANYLFGRTLFIATDGLLRDDGENYETKYEPEIHADAVRRIGMALREMRFTAVYAAADESHDLADPVGAAAREFIEPVTFCRDADRFVKEFVPKNNRAELFLATSDSKLIDGTVWPVMDLAFEVLRRNFNPVFPDLGKYFLSI